MSRWSLSWSGEGSVGEVLKLALPFILSNSFMTIQITVDRIMLSHASPEAVAASMPAAVLFWTMLTLLQNTSNYATTFVAQYVGAGRPRRVGPSVWQAIHFSLLTGLGFLGFVLLAEPLIALGDHAPAIQGLEVVYFRCLCFSALPALLTAATSSFFAGRGDSWTVLLINASGSAVNAFLDWVWIYGRLGFAAMGIEGAGWATVAGAWASAALGFGLMARRRYREEFQSLAGWRLDLPLFGRLMKFGLPNGLQWTLDALAFTMFLVFVGRLGVVELTSTSLAITINMVAFLPMFGIGQAVTVLVGQRLGHDRPDLAERATWSGFWSATAYMCMVAALFALAPGLFLMMFQGEGADSQVWQSVSAMVPILLRFVALYSLFDAMNLVFSFALRGAGDTRFVTLVALLLSWPVMVLPTWAAWKYSWGIYWSWGFASTYIITLAFVFLVRFRHGKWKSMRVIEPKVVEEGPAAVLPAAPGEDDAGEAECLLTGK